MSLQRQTAYSGAITKGSQKRITKAVNLLIMAATDRVIYNEVTGKYFKHKLSFITLTISENERNLQAKEAYNLLLRPFLQWATKYKGIKTYIWKLELQQRGQIHYHITTTSFLNWKEIREKWNNLQNAAGLLESFYAKYNHRSPNSTDIHEVYKKADLTGYLIKYIAKAEAKETRITGKVWDCSLNLKVSKYPDYEVNNDQSDYLHALRANNYLQVTQRDSCSILKIKQTPGHWLLTEANEENYQKTITELRTQLQEQLPFL